MSNYKTLFTIGPLPTPITGQSVALKMLCDELKRRNLPLKIINIYGSKKMQEPVFFL